LVRVSYIEISEKILSLARTDRGCVIKGNPGIGKSCFLSYCLWRFASGKKTVVFESVEQQGRWVFRPNGSVSFHSRSTFVPELDVASTYYLFDPYGNEADEARGTYAFTIVASSPNPDHFKGFQKRLRCETTFFMPCWSLEELYAIRASAPGILDEDEVKARFEVVGGIPRYIFQSAPKFDNLKSYIDLKLDNIDLKVISKALGNPEEGDEISHKLIQYEVDTTSYTKSTVKFASEYVEVELPKRASKDSLKQLGEMIDNLARVGNAAVLNGHLFEHFAHTVYPRGITLRARQLTAKGQRPTQPETIAFPEVDSRMFKNAAELKSALVAGCYARPKKPTYAAVDAIASYNDGIVFLQYTRGKVHPISLDQLYEDLKVAQSVNRLQKKFRFYFVVPPHRFNAFKMQALKFEDGTAPKLAEVKKYIEQWVLELKTTV